MAECWKMHQCIAFLTYTVACYRLIDDEVGERDGGCEPEGSVYERYLMPFVLLGGTRGLGMLIAKMVA